MTPEELDQYATVMRKHDVRSYTVAQDARVTFRIELEPSKPVATPVNVDVEQAKREAIKREDEILFASSEGFAR